MADGYEHFERPVDYQEGGGSSFIIGLLTGTVLGAGLGMLFAPRAGSEIRSKISEQANEGYRRASESAGHWAERGRDVYQKAADAVAKGADEAKRYVREAKDAAASKGYDPSSTYATGAAYGSSAEDIRSESSESMRGSAMDRDTSAQRRS